MFIKKNDIPKNMLYLQISLEKKKYEREKVPSSLMDEKSAGSLLSYNINVYVCMCAASTSAEEHNIQDGDDDYDEKRRNLLCLLQLQEY